jgi:uncharacterized protein (DUF1684 family)
MPNDIADAQTGYETWRQSRWEEMAGLNGKAGLTIAQPIIAPNHSVAGVPGRWSPGVTPGTVTLTVGDEEAVFVDGQRVARTAELHPNSRIELSGDRRGFIVQDSGMTLLTVWDPAVPTLTRLREILTYPFDPTWVVEANYQVEPADRAFTASRLPQGAESLAAPANVVFDLGGQQHTLIVVRFHGGLHVGFTDLTTGNDSSPHGRWLHLPERPGNTIGLDFNQAVVDNHAFSPVFPCYLPVAENHLPLAVTAGERMPAYND